MSKNEKLAIRLSSEDKTVLETAAGIQDVSTSSFVRDVAVVQAKKVIKKNK